MACVQHEVGEQGAQPGPRGGGFGTVYAHRAEQEEAHAPILAQFPAPLAVLMPARAGAPGVQLGHLTSGEKVPPERDFGGAAPAPHRVSVENAGVPRHHPGTHSSPALC
ncbi:hypothetical protein GCM10010289_19350 [Streptomyces violascens]|uniref:Uncharacterized protein n=1 Tax=Streptomyces violascens TaxID=67381 RepID=A0ABQ3QMB9_9ACTN|nr:hypothetical protein GCM10010289_19350 [Streptomyces violascens]GHI38379.1 hypothetical protein Sviol_27870 [Streptomyces violascens]